MPIRFKCPNPACQKVLTVKDHLAGKKAACPACKHVLTIPRPPAVKPAPAPASSAPAPPDGPSAPRAEAPPHDADELAAALLADEPQKAPEPVQTISMTCPYCDEEVQFSADLAGRQAQCPNEDCRRIVKVPLPQGQKKIDWRDPNAGVPTVATMQQEAPEGVWGSTAKRNVSAEALAEAGALPSKRTPLTARDWIKRGVYTAAGLGVVVVGVMLVLNWMAGRKQEQMLEKALAAVSGEGEGVKLKGADGAVVHLAAGLYHLRRDEEDCIQAEKGDAGAVQQFNLARGRLARGGGPDAHALLIELALAQADMGGEARQVEQRSRLTWKDVSRELEGTLRTVSQPEARVEGVRRVARKLIEKGQGDLAARMATRLDAGPAGLSAVGLELLRAGQDQAAQQLFAQVEYHFPKDKNGDKDKKDGNGPARPPLTAEVAAFYHALGREDKLPQAADEKRKTVYQTGQAAARAARGKAGEARAAAAGLAFPEDRLRALVLVAELATNAGEAKTTAEEALKLVETELANQPLPGWVLVRLARVGAAAGVAEDRILVLTRNLSEEPGLRGWVQLPVARARISRGGAADESAVQVVEKGSLAHALARVELAEHNARSDDGMADTVEGWDESVRPYGYAGVALGLQAVD